MLVDLFHSDPRPVVFTGAQRTADHPCPDGPGNVSHALRVASDSSSRDRGVLVAFGGHLMAARGLIKVHTSSPRGFRTTAESRVVLPQRRLSNVRVDIISLYPGADATAILAAVKVGAHGLVLVATGSGNTSPHVVDAVRRCTQANLPVVITTRVPFGTVLPTYGGGANLRDAGARFSGNLRAGQARILLAAELAQHSASQHQVAELRDDTDRLWIAQNQDVTDTKVRKDASAIHISS